MKLLVAIALILSAAHVFALPTVREMDEFEKGMFAKHEDLAQLWKFSRGSDQDVAGRLVVVSRHSIEEVTHVYDMIHIYSLVTNDADKTAILSYINQRLSFSSKRIDFSIKEVNLEVSSVKGAALISAADRLKADLRTFQTMIATPH